MGKTVGSDRISTSVILFVLLSLFVLLALLLSSRSCSRGFKKNDELQVKVNKLSSTKTQLPYDFYFLDHCKPSKIMKSAENLGEVLHGDQIENSVYSFNMRMSENCKVSCLVKLNGESAKRFKQKIDNQYRVNMILDKLPIAVLRHTDGSQPSL